MVEYFSEDLCRELNEKYSRLVVLVESAIELKTEIKRLQNHPINDFPSIIKFELPNWWEAKGVQAHLLSNVFDFLNDFKHTRNKKLKHHLASIEELSIEILQYDSL